MKVLLIAGGTSNEREVSIRSGDAVEKALKAVGYEVRRTDPGADGYSLEAAAADMDVAFVALHGAGGEDGTIQIALENIGLPYVGSDASASELCWDKWRFKQLLIENKLPASDGLLVSISDLGNPAFKQPFVLKPVRGGSTIDMLIARTTGEDKLDSALKLLEKYDHMIVEPLIEGVEITMPVLGDKALPAIEIVPPEGLEFDYENKYNGATAELCPPKNVSGDIQKQAQKLAVSIHKLTGCRDMSRIDMMVDQSGKLHVLESNTIPGLTEQSLFPKSAAVAGIDMTSLVKQLVESAFSRG